MNRITANKLIYLLAGIGLLASSAVYAADAPPAPPPAKVKVAKVETRSVAEKNSFLGVLFYDRLSNVSSDIAGLVYSTKVKEGDTVAEGDLLVKLDTELLEQEIATLETQVEQLQLRILHTEKDFARLAKPLETNGSREYYMPATVDPGGIRPLAPEDRGLFAVLSQSNALLIRPVGDAARNAGDAVEYLPI